MSRPAIVRASTHPRDAGPSDGNELDDREGLEKYWSVVGGATFPVAGRAARSDLPSIVEAGPSSMEQEQPIDPDRWVDDHGDALYAYAMLRLRDADLASEVVQDTFLEALRARSRFLGQSTERTWLVGILKHKIVDQIRRRYRRERATGGEDPSGLEAGEFFDERGSWKVPVGRWADLPDRAIERAEFWEVFRACLAELPPNHAEAFTLIELEGLSGPEACKILAIAPTNLWARLHRARLQLRRSLEARWFGREAGRDLDP